MYKIDIIVYNITENKMQESLKGTISVDHLTKNYKTHELSYYNKEINKIIFRYAVGWKSNRIKLTFTRESSTESNKQLYVLLELYYEDGTVVDDQTILNVSKDGTFKHGVYSHQRYDTENLIEIEKDLSIFFRIEESSNDTKKNIHRQRNFVLRATIVTFNQENDSVNKISTTLKTCPIVSLSKFKYSVSSTDHSKKQKLNNSTYGDEIGLALEPEATILHELINL